MIFNKPDSSQELWTQLEKAVSTMPEEHAELFLYDLMRFCVEWQFGYEAVQREVDNQQVEDQKRRPLKEQLTNL